jgi:transcriptional regulator with XRE-family HTH domain
MTNDWDRLAQAIRRQRQALGLTQQQLAAAAEVTRSTIKNLEGGRAFTRLPASLPSVEQALDWKPGSARTVLAGGEPTVASVEPVPRIDDSEYELEVDPEVGTIVHNTVYEVLGVVAPNMTLREVREVEALALAAVMSRGGRPRRRHPQAFDESSASGDETG